MMTQNFFSKLTGIVVLILFFIGCRQETFIAEQKQPSQNISRYNTKILDYEEFQNKKELNNKIYELRSNVFKQTNIASKNTVTIQDSILEGAIIETSRVLEITEGSNVTYTFPVSRTFPNSKIENLVLKKNSDNTYTGVLMQYELTEQERQQYRNGNLTNFDDKISVFPIENLAIAAKSYIYSYYEGCWEYVYEAHPCTAGGNDTYGDPSCEALQPGGNPSQAAQPSTIIAAYNHCDDSSGGSGGSPGGSSSGGSPSGSSSGGSTGSFGGGGGGSGSINTSPFNTYLFISFDDQLLMCADGDTQCAANWANIAMTVDYFNSLGKNGIVLSSYNPIFNMVKDYSLSSNQPINLSESINIVGNWKKLQDNSTEEKNLENFKFAHWALSEMLNNNIANGNFILNLKSQNPNMTFNQYKSWFVDYYSDEFKTRILQLSSTELQDYININTEISSSPYLEEYIYSTNEAFVAFTAYADIDTMTEAQIQTVLNNNCCAGLFIQQQATETAKLIATNYLFYRKFFPEWSKSKCFWEASRETIQLLLDLGGLIPVIGEVCDLTNGVIYTIQGDGVNAALSYGAAIPIAGWFSTGGKFGVKVVNAASDVYSRQLLKWVIGTDGFIKFGYRNQLRKVLKLTDKTKHAHHIIPWEFANYPIVQKAAKSSNAFHLNEALNGIPLPSTGHLTGHSAYNTKLQQILNSVNQSNPNMSSNQAYNHIVAITNQIKSHIINHPNYNLGQIANLISYP